MKSEDLSKTNPRQLAQLMETAGSGRNLWQPDDLQAILEHLLVSPVVSAMTPGGCEDSSPTFEAALMGPEPSAATLEQVKQFAKACRKHPDSPLPPDVAEVLYFASIVSAQARCGRNISALSEQALCAGVEKILRFVWVKGQLRQMLEAWRSSER